MRVCIGKSSGVHDREGVERKNMGELIRSEEKKQRIGVFVHNLRVQDGGSYQYVEFILDALLECTDSYDITIVCTIPDWETTISQRLSLR